MICHIYIIYIYICIYVCIIHCTVKLSITLHSCQGTSIYRYGFGHVFFVWGFPVEMKASFIKKMAVVGHLSLHKAKPCEAISWYTQCFDHWYSQHLSDTQLLSVGHGWPPPCHKPPSSPDKCFANAIRNAVLGDGLLAMKQWNQKTCTNTTLQQNHKGYKSKNEAIRKGKKSKSWDIWW